MAKKANAKPADIPGFEEAMGRAVKAALKSIKEIASVSPAGMVTEEYATLVVKEAFAAGAAFGSTLTMERMAASFADL